MLVGWFFTWRSHISANTRSIKGTTEGLLDQEGTSEDRKEDERENRKEGSEERSRDAR